MAYLMPNAEIPENSFATLGDSATKESAVPRPLPPKFFLLFSDPIRTSTNSFATVKYPRIESVLDAEHASLSKYLKS